MADPIRNADRIGELRDDLDDLRGTLSSEIDGLKAVVTKWAFRVLMAHLGAMLSLVAGLALALLT